MRTIWKYTIDNKSGNSIIKIPENSLILSAKNQNEKLCIWALVDSRTQLKETCITCYLTGSSIEYDVFSSYRFIDTVLFDNGEFIVHVFEKLL